jgi:integrase
MRKPYHIRERSLERWAIIFSERDSATGRRKRKWHSFKGTKREAQIEAARLLTERENGTLIDPKKVRVSQFLEQWLEYVKPRVSPKSYERYSEIVYKNIVPALGGIVLTKLRPAHISHMYGMALVGGRRDGKGGLAPSTVVYMHRITKHALSQAVRWEMLARNPAEAVDPPKIERGAITTFDMAQTAKLLEALRGTRLFIPVLLAVLCGLRRGEIAALRWRNVDLPSGTLMVVESAEQTATSVRYKPPKSGRGRAVALSKTVLSELCTFRLGQAEELLRAGVRQTDDTFVYTREDGEPMQPRSLTRAWQQALGKTNLPLIRFHDLRHAHATHLLANGVHPKVASERLGHSKVGITLDLYSHVLPGMQEDAAARVDDALQRALQKRT